MRPLSQLLRPRYNQLHMRTKGVSERVLGIFSIFISFLFVLLFTFSIFGINTKLAYAESVNVNLLVAVCNENLICEDVIGENYGSCPSDCEAPPPPPTPTSTSSSTPSGPGAGYTSPGGSTGGPTGSGSSTTGFPLDPNFPSGPGPNNGQNNGQNTPNNNAGTGKPGQGSTIRPPGSIPDSGIDGIIKIAPYTTHVTLTFKTFLSSLLNMSWGKTGTYELGSMADSWYHQNFSKDITDLEPGTRYYYRLELLDSLGRKNEYEGQFMTASLRSTAPLPVVVNFGISNKRESDSAILSWNIKPAKDTILDDLRKESERRLNQNISLKEELEGAKVDSEEELQSQVEKVYVRLVRSEFGFPKDPFEGKVVYEGNGEQTTDIGLRDNTAYYYSIFVMNGKGEYSSPAIIKYIHKIEGQISEKEKKEAEIKKRQENIKNTQFDPLIQDKNQIDIEQWLDPDTKTGFCGYSQLVQPTLSLKDTFSGISPAQKGNFSTQFMSDGQAIEPKLGSIRVDGRNKLIIRLKSDQFEAGDKVGICLFSKRHMTYTDYLLTKNDDGTFELIFPAISTILSGKSDYQFTIGMIKYNGAEMVLERGEISFFVPSEQNAFSWFEIQIILMILCVVFWIRKRIKLSTVSNR